MLRQACLVVMDFDFAYCYQRITVTLIWNNNKKVKFIKLCKEFYIFNVKDEHAKKQMPLMYDGVIFDR